MCIVYYNLADFTTTLNPESPRMTASGMVQTSSYKI